MTKMTPERWAIDITNLLNAVYKNDSSHRFPVDVASVALEYSKTKFPTDPIANIAAGEFDRFEGCLNHENGWNIIYNKKMSKGRVNFTIAHEFGHYLLHRQDLANGIECDSNAMRNWNSAEAIREKEANVFASYLLIPLDDFRAQTQGRQINLELLQKLSGRYGTSLTATVLKYLDMISGRAILIASKDGFVDWAWSSDKARKTKKYIAARNPKNEPHEVPADSMAARQIENLTGEYKEHGGWFGNVGYTEMNLPKSDNDDNLTLLILDDEDYPEEDPDAVVVIRR
jgi:Zn-dependent peptidase ImmA (M78 family)